MPSGVKLFTLPPGTRLPNEGSELQTPTTLAIDLRYEDLRIWRRWDWARFVQLCRFLKVTPAELASIACIPHHHLEVFEARNRLYVAQAPNRAATMLLTLLEAHVAKAYYHDVVPNPFPDLNNLATPKPAPTPSSAR